MSRTSISTCSTLPKHSQRSLLTTIALLSGVAGLGYQMVWTRLLAVSLGHEVASVLAVIAAFFVGLSLGGLLINKWIQSCLQPARWYAMLEGVIALWSLALIVLMPWFNQFLPSLVGANPNPTFHWTISFTATLILLAPATVAMGATLPLLEHTAVVQLNNRHRIAKLYALNTCGAVVGTLLATFFLMPTLGLSQTLMVLAAINILCVLGAMQLSRSKALSTVLHTELASPPDKAQIGHQKTERDNRLLLTCFILGWAGIGYEVVAVRVLSQVMENTVYSFALALASYLFFTAIGAHYYQRRHAGQTLTYQDWQRRLRYFLLLTAAACAIGVVNLFFANTLYLNLLGVLTSFGDGFVSAMLAEVLIAVLIFALPTFSMGLLFCHLIERAVNTTGLGKALASNTLGAALAPISFGIVAIPLLGSKLTLALIILIYLCVQGLYFTKANSPSTAAHRVRENQNWLSGIGLTAVLFLALLPQPLRHLLTQTGSKLIEYREGVLASVAVIEDAKGNRHLKVNNHFTMGGTATRFSDHRQSHLPLLLHGNPHSVLYLGLGTGVTMEAAQYYPDLDVTGVELIPELIPLLPTFGVQTQNFSPRLIAADARRFVVSDQGHYDVIIGEIFHPSRDGAGALYTKEHFQAVRQRLASNGLFAQWLPLFQLDNTTLKMIAATFLEVFPDSQLYLGHLSLQQPILCLVGNMEPQRYEADWLQTRVQSRNLQQSLINTRLNSDFALFGGFLGGSQALQAFAADAPLNTDDFPEVNFRAPAFVYRQQALPAERLAEILQFFGAQPDEFQLAEASQGKKEFARHLLSYRQGRDQFLLAGIAALGSDSMQDMLSVTKEPLLKIVASSAEFEPAYRTLLASAEGIFSSDPQASLALLQRMEDLRPEYSEARQLRKNLQTRVRN